MTCETWESVIFPQHFKSLAWNVQMGSHVPVLPAVVLLVALLRVVVSLARRGRRVRLALVALRWLLLVLRDRFTCRCIAGWLVGEPLFYLLFYLFI